MNEATYMRFAIVVMDRGQPEGWRERFLERLAQGASTLRGEKLGRGEVTLQGEKLLLQGEWIGNARFEPLEHADDTLSRWIAAGSRPFIGAPAGLFVWSHFMAPSDAQDLVETLAHAALGAGYRHDTHELREHVVRRRFQLTNLTSEYGFDEGAALLERQPGLYIDDVIAAVSQVLAADRIDAWVGFSREAVGNNPIRLYPPVEVAGELIPNAHVDRVLYPLDVEIWALHEKLGDSLDAFWYDLDA